VVSTSILYQHAPISILSDLSIPLGKCWNSTLPGHERILSNPFQFITYQQSATQHYVVRCTDGVIQQAINQLTQ